MHGWIIVKGKFFLKLVSFIEYYENLKKEQGNKY